MCDMCDMCKYIKLAILDYVSLLLLERFDCPGKQNNYISVDTISVDMNPETLVIKKRNYSEQRSPTLNTVLMVEDTLKRAGEVVSIGKLKRLLPKQVMHQTLMSVVDYLEYSGKIIVHDGKVLWAFKPQSKLKNMRGLTVR